MCAAAVLDTVRRRLEQLTGVERVLAASDDERRSGDASQVVPDVEGVLGVDRDEHVARVALGHRAGREPGQWLCRSTQPTAGNMKRTRFAQPPSGSPALVMRASSACDAAPLRPQPVGGGDHHQPAHEVGPIEPRAAAPPIRPCSCRAGRRAHRAPSRSRRRCDRRCPTSTGRAGDLACGSPRRR